MHSFLGIEIHATISTVKTITLFKFVISGVSSVKGLQKGKQYEILRPRLADFPLSMPDNPIFQSFDANCTIFRVYIAVNEAVNSCSLRWTQQFLIAWIGFQIIVSWTWLGNRTNRSVWINFYFLLLGSIFFHKNYRAFQSWILDGMICQELDLTSEFLFFKILILDVVDYISCRYFYITIIIIIPIHRIHSAWLCNET